MCGQDCRQPPVLALASTRSIPQSTRAAGGGAGNLEHRNSDRPAAQLGLRPSFP